jgi:hypothetical protein
MNTTQEERNEIALLAMKSVLNHIPFVGPSLNIMFEYRGKVKEKRLNNFLEILKKYFSIANPDVDLGRIKSEEFGDLFENVIKKITLTSAQKKLEGFKNILLKGMSSINEIEYCEIFAELLSTIHEKQIEILQTHAKILETYSLTERRSLSQRLFEVQRLIEADVFIDRGDNNKYINSLRTEEKRLIVKIADMKKEGDYNNQFRIASFYNVTVDKYSYFIQDLFNKGLLFDEGIGGIGVNPFDVMLITDLGNKFLNYIKEERD